MITRLLPHEIIYIVTAILAAAVLLLAWPRRKAPGGIYFIYHLIALMIWVICLLFEAASIEQNTKILWSQISYIGVVTVAPFFFCFVLAYTNQSELKANFIISLFVPPILVLIAAFTNSYHHLLWPSFTWGSPEYNILIYGHGFVYYVNIIYIYSLIFFGVIQLVRKITTSKPPFRSQLVVILIGIFFPILSGMLYTLRIDPVPGMDISAFGFLITNLLLVLGFTRYQLLDLVPVAHDVLISRFQDGMIVVDWQNRIVEINDHASKLIRLDQTNVLGKKLEGVIAWHLNLEEMSRSKSLTEFKVGNEANEFIDLQVSSLNPVSDTPPGYLLVLRDISDQKAAELSLQKANRELMDQIHEINRLQKLLEDQATHDTLTGLYNRRLMDEILSSQLAQSERSGTPLSIIVLDIDHFKEINDSFGHQIGDEFLKEYGKSIRSTIRKGDFACRLGGDEFLIAFPNMEISQALKKANDLRLLLHNIVISYEKTLVRTTCSLGVASFPQHGATIAQVINAADQALYSAKEKGRNLAERAA